MTRFNRMGQTPYTEFQTLPLEEVFPDLPMIQNQNLIFIKSTQAIAKEHKVVVFVTRGSRQVTKRTGISRHHNYTFVLESQRYIGRTGQA